MPTYQKLFTTAGGTVTGTTTFSSDLNVSGNLNLSNASSAKIKISKTGVGAGDYVLYHDGNAHISANTMLYISNASGAGMHCNGVANLHGNVGLGTGVTTKTHLSTQDYVTIGQEGQYIIGANTSTFDIAIANNIYQDASGNFEWATSGHPGSVYKNRYGTHEFFVSNGTGTGGDDVTLVSALKIDNTGNVEIAKGTPTLTLKQTDTSSNHIEMKNSSGSVVGRLKYDTAGGNHMYLENRNAGNLVLETGDTARLTIDSSGNTTLSGDLTITGGDIISGATLGLDANGSGTGTIYLNGGVIVNENSNDVDFRIESNGNANMFFVDGGNNRIGIGTTSPQSALSFATSSTIGVATTDGSDNGLISFSGGGAAGNNRGGTIYLSGNERSTYGGRIDIDAGNVSATGIISMVTGAVERMVIDYYGNVGIGTASPDTNMHIHKATAGSITADGNVQLVVENNTHVGMQFLSPNDAQAQILFGDVDDGDIGYINYNHDTNALSFATNTAVGMTINSAGNVGIGVTPKATQSGFDALQIGGNANITSYGTQGAGGEVDFGHNYYYSAAGTDKYISTDEATQFRQGSGNFVFRTAPSGSADAAITFTERMRITQAGNVGINNTTPLNILQVGPTGPGLGISNMNSWGGYWLGQNMQKSSTNGRLTRAESSATYYPIAISFGYQDVAGFASEDSKGGINFITTGSNISGDIDPDTYSRMYIAGDGHIGMGTCAPLAKLDVDGATYVGAGTSDSIDLSSHANNNSYYGICGPAGYWGIRTATDQSFNIDTYNSGSSLCAIAVKQDGKIGIGTKNPTQKLQISSGGADGGIGLLATGGYNNHIEFGDGDDADIGKIIYDHGADAMTFITNTSERMRITSDGRIGIGVTPDGNTNLHLKASHPSRALLHTSSDTAGNYTGLWFKVDSTSTGASTRAKACIQFVRDDPGTRGTGKLYFAVDGVNDDGGADYGADSVMALDSNSRISLSNNDSGGTGGSDSTSGNTVLGYLSGASIASGGLDNTFYGHKAGNSITTGDGNTLIGSNCATAMDTERDNTVIGYDAFNGNIDGADSCVIIGKSAVASAHTQDGTVAVGASALGVCTSGAGNTAVGYQALDEVTTGGMNTAVGYQALHQIDSGEENCTAVGYQAGSNLDGGIQNVFFGSGTTVNGASDDNNTIIGQASVGGGTNSTTLGYGVTGQAANSVTLGNANVTDVYLGHDGRSAKARALSLSTGSQGGASITLREGSNFGQTHTIDSINITGHYYALHTSNYITVANGQTNKTYVGLSALMSFTDVNSRFTAVKGAVFNTIASTMDGNLSSGSSIVGVENNVDVTESTNYIQNVYGYKSLVNLDDGRTGTNVYGQYVEIDIEANHEVDGNVYGSYIKVVDDDASAGEAYGLAIEAGAGVDACIKLSGGGIKFDDYSKIYSDSEVLKFLDFDENECFNIQNKLLKVKTGITLGPASAEDQDTDLIFDTGDESNSNIIFKDEGTAKWTIEHSCKTAGANQNSLTWTSADTNITQPAIRFIQNGKASFAGVVTANGVTLNSDVKFKTNIKDIPSALDTTLKLRGVSYTDKQDKSSKFGVIAQEIEKVMPNVVMQEEHGKTVDYIQIIPMLIESIKELKHEVDTLKNKCQCK